MVGGRGGFLEGGGEEVEGVDDSVFCGDGRLREIVVQDLDGVGDDEGFGGGVDDLEAAVVVEGGANCEALAPSVAPRGAFAWLGVDDDGRAEWGYGGGVEVEGAVEMLPGGHGRVDVGLA